MLRNDREECIMAFPAQSNYNSNNASEALAAGFGVNQFIQHGYTDFTLEMDSLIVTNMIKNDNTSNYNLKRIMEET